MAGGARALALLLLALALAGVEAGAVVQVADPAMEEFRDYVVEAGIPDWPVTYRGHLLYVNASLAVGAVVGPCDGCEAAAPNVSYRLVFNATQFELVDETSEYNVTWEPGGNATRVTVAVYVEAVLRVRPNASVFELEDWSGNYTREQICVEWAVTRYHHGSVYNETVVIEDCPDPEYLRIYARQPVLGLDVWVAVVGDPEACDWGAASLLLHVLNPGLGVPPPGDPDWGLLANLTPGQLIVEGLGLNVSVVEPDGDVVRTLSWTGSLKAAVDEGLVLDVTPLDPSAHRRLTVAVSALAYWDEPVGPALKPVLDASSTASLPWTWITVLDAPAPVVYASSRAGGAVYTAEAPWPARLCLPPGSYELRCSGCTRLWVVANDPVEVSVPATPPARQPPLLPEPGGPGAAWLLLLLAGLLGYATTRIWSW